MKAGLKPAEIAAQCGVTSNSIRNWSKEFRFHLSEGANAPERYYTNQDATVLRYISTLKQEGMKTHEIAERLAEMTFGEAETLEVQPAPLAVSESRQNLSGATITPTPAQQEGQDLTPAVLMVVDALEKRFEAKFATIEQAKVNDRRLVRDGVFMFMAGSVVTLLIVLIVLVALSAYAGK